MQIKVVRPEKAQTFDFGFVKYLKKLAILF